MTRRGSFAADILQKVHPFEQLHGEKPALTVKNQLVKRDKVRVGDAQERAKFTLEAQDCGGTGTVHHFQGDRTAALAIVSAIDSAHAAAAEHGLYVIATEHRPGRPQRQSQGRRSLAESLIGFSRCVRALCIVFAGAGGWARDAEIERSSREFEREREARLECPVDLELVSEFSGVLRKPPQILLQLGRFTVVLAENDFAINQVQQFFIVDDRRRKLAKEGLDRQPLSLAPTPAMILNEREWGTTPTGRSIVRR